MHEMMGGAMPLISTNPLPPLWPLLGRAVRPEVVCPPPPTPTPKPSPKPSARAAGRQSQQPSGRRAGGGSKWSMPPTFDVGDNASSSELEDEQCFLEWLQVPRRASCRHTLAPSYPRAFIPSRSTRAHPPRLASPLAAVLTATRT